MLLIRLVYITYKFYEKRWTDEVKANKVEMNIAGLYLWDHKKKIFNTWIIDRRISLCKKNWLSITKHSGIIMKGRSDLSPLHFVI